MRKFAAVKGAPADTILPRRGTKGSAGYDLFIPCDLDIPSHGFSDMIRLNIKVYMEPDEFFAMYMRSGLATTKGKMKITQGTAIVDSDYVDNPTNDGNIGLVFQNCSDEWFHFNKGDRCAQGIFQKYYLTDDDDCTEVRYDGFGSTGR